MVSGVEVITIGEGVIVYQCEEGLVPEGRVEAMCGDDGRWSPDPTQHMCRTIINLNTTATTAATATTSTTGMTCTSLSRYNIILMVLGLTFFLFGLLVKRGCGLGKEPHDLLPQ